MMNSGFFQGKGFAAGVSLLTVGAVLWPVLQNWREQPKDDFPLSYYPMFSKKRRRSESVIYLVGVDKKGGRRLIRYDHAGTGGLNQVRRQIRRLVREGRAEDLSRLVGTSIVERRDGRYADVTTVEVVTGRYDLDEYFVGRRKVPASETVHASLLVERGEDEPTL